MDAREELSALRRMAELESKAAGVNYRANVEAEPNSRLVRSRQMPMSDVPSPISYDQRGVPLYNEEESYVPEVVTPDQKAIASKGLLRRANDEILGAFEVPTAIGMGTVGALTAIPFGIAEQAITGKMTRAEQYLKDMQYKPQTPEGRRNLEALGELVNSEALRPLQGAVNLPFSQLVPKGSIAPAVNYAKNVVGQEAALAAQPITRALETRAANKLIEKTAASYERGPQIDAAKEASRLGILLNPVTSNPTKVNKLLSTTMDPTELDAKLVQENLPKYSNIAKAEMGIPKNTALTSSAVFDDARNNVAGPYNDIRKIEQFTADQKTLDSLDNIRPQALIGGKTAANVAGSLVDDAIEQLSKGMSGKDLIENISQLKKDANRSRASIAATADDLHIADVKMKIVSALEDMIDSNVSDPKLLSAYKKARADMAKIYAYEAATDITTGYVDPQKLNKLLDKGVPLSGDAKAMAQIAGNFPDTVTLKIPTKSGIPQLVRSGIPGTIGAGIGVLTGIGPIAGGAIGAGVGKIATKVGGKLVARPGYQATMAVPEDFRPPVNNLRPVEPNFNRNLPVIFNPENAVVSPEIRPNFTSPKQAPLKDLREFDAQFNPQGAVSLQLPALPPPSAESTLAGVNQRRAFDYNAAQQAEAQAAQQAPARVPTSGGVAFELDPITGRLREVSQGMKGATPETFQNYGTSLESAVNKVSAGKAFDLTAEERIAFNKTKVDLAQVEPGYAKLSDKQITERMMDRQWIADTIQKAREQAIAFEQIAARAESEQARFNAMAQRQRMMDLADSMEEKMRMGRPDTSRKTQGPKTREAKRNALAEDIEIKNKLAR
jgi:hypothetical protein